MKNIGNDFSEAGAKCKTFSLLGWHAQNFRISYVAIALIGSAVAFFSIYHM